MSEMTSFYGGRQGAGFVIKKRFDVYESLKDKDPVYAIDYFEAEENKELKNYKGEHSVDGVEYIEYSDEMVIRKRLHTSEESGVNWIKLQYDGKGLKEVKAESMTDCFAEGLNSTSEVNYGEYVLIDTITNLKDYNNPYHGHVYRRTMGGPEFVGSFTGVAGPAPFLEFVEYKEPEKGMIPTTFTLASEKEIKEGISNVPYSLEPVYWKDIDGNNMQLKGYEIGLKLPYYINEITDITTNSTKIDEEGEVINLWNPTITNGDKEGDFYQPTTLNLPMHMAEFTSAEIKDSKLFLHGKQPNKEYNDYDTFDIPVDGAINSIEAIRVSNDKIAKHDGVPYNHLLVLNSDPEKQGDKKYPIKDGEEEIEGWKDLGNVQGEPGGIHIIGHFNELPSYKPEELPLTKNNEPGNYPDHAGWAITIDSETSSDSKILYFYDYTKETWYEYGKIQSTTPEDCIIVCKEDDSQQPIKDNITLDLNGLWFIAEDAKCV